MEELMAICIVGFITLGIYRVFELFARRKERMAIIDKLEHIKSLDTNVDLKLSLFQKSENSNWALRISLLLIGIGLGLLVAYGVEMAIIRGNMDFYSPENYDIRRSFNSGMEVVYFASVAFFGGIGLLSAYFIEQKQKQK